MAERGYFRILAPSPSPSTSLPRFVPISRLTFAPPGSPFVYFALSRLGRRIDDDSEQNPEVFAQELLTRYDVYHELHHPHCTRLALKTLHAPPGIDGESPYRVRSISMLRVAPIRLFAVQKATARSVKRKSASSFLPQVFERFVTLQHLDHARDRCKDESGQLNARVLGIKKVRQTVTEGWRDARGGGGAKGNTANENRNGGGNGPKPAGGGSGGVDEQAVAAVAAAQSQDIHGGVLPKGVGGKAAPGYSNSR